MKEFNYPSSCSVSPRNFKFYLGNKKPGSSERSFLRLCLCEQSPAVPGSSWGCTEPSAAFAALPHLPWPGRQRHPRVFRQKSEFAAPWCPVQNLSLVFFKGLRRQGRAGWQCPGSQCWSSALCSARLQTLLSSLNLQP